MGIEKKTVETHTWTDRVLLAFNRDGSLREAAVYQLSRSYADGQPLGPEIYSDPFPVKADDVARYMPAHARLIEQNGALLTEVGQHFAAAIEADADKSKALDRVAELEARADHARPLRR